MYAMSRARINVFLILLFESEQKMICRGGEMCRDKVTVSFPSGRRRGNGETHLPSLCERITVSEVAERYEGFVALWKERSKYI